MYDSNEYGTVCGNGSEEHAGERGDRSFRLYMRDIHALDLYTDADRERDTAVIKSGHPREKALARKRFIAGNLKLVVTIAGDYEGMGVPLLDLIGEGNSGLVEAVGRFDPSKGRLSTYAGWWIRQRIKAALTSAMSARSNASPHVIEGMRAIRNIQKRFRDVHGRDPSDAETADEAGIKESTVRAWRRASGQHRSLDEPVETESGQVSLGDTIADEKARTAPEVLILEADLQRIPDIILLLDRRHRRVIDKLYGFHGTPITQKALAPILKCTRSRVGQLRDAALGIFYRELRGRA